MASALGAALESLKESNYVKYVILRSELCCAIYPTSPAAIVRALKVSAELCSIPGLSI